MQNAFAAVLLVGNRGSKKQFKKKFHAEARRQYDVNVALKGEKTRFDQLNTSTNPSAAGFLLKEDHIAKPHDTNTVQINLQKLGKCTKDLDILERSVKSHLNSTVNTTGTIKTGWRTAHDFDEKTLTGICEVQNKISDMTTKLKEFDENVKLAFPFNYTANKRKSRSRKQNRHHATSRKKRRCEQRPTEVLQAICKPSFEVGKTCRKEDLDESEIGRLGKRQRQWAHVLVESTDTLMTKDARDFLRQKLQLQPGESSAESDLADDDSGDSDDSLGADSDEHVDIPGSSSEDEDQDDQ